MLDIFKSDIFLKSVSESLKEITKKSAIIDIYLSGPFRNQKTGLMHWSVIYGSLGAAWMMKSSFMGGYVRSVLTSLNFRNDYILHTGSYYDINIQNIEFGEVSKWKRKNKKRGTGGTVSRMSFVFSCKINEEAFGLTRLRNIIDKIMWSMKARPHNSMGKLIWEFCKKEEEHICNYLMNQHHKEEAIKEKITASVDSTFENGYSLKLSTHLNQFMVDYDIIQILKTKMGYNC